MTDEKQIIDGVINQSNLVGQQEKQLDITMSWGDAHIKQIITWHRLFFEESPESLITEHALRMYRKLREPSHN